jgi:hypothetical protein
MARKKRNAPVPRKQRSWTVAKFLLIIGYGAVFAFLGVIYMMRQELFRVGIFGEKKAVHTPVPKPTPPQVTTESQRPAPSSSPQVAKEEPRQRSAPSSTPATSAAPSGEITAEEKRALEDILRSKR